MLLIESTIIAGCAILTRKQFQWPLPNRASIWLLSGYTAIAGTAGVGLAANLGRLGFEMGKVLKTAELHPEQKHELLLAGFLPMPQNLSDPRSPWIHGLEILVLSGIFASLFTRLNINVEDKLRLENEARKSREQALRAKLAPHFIFNTLNTLHAQIAQDPQQAQATTEKLAQVFRQVVQVSDAPTIPLRQELSFVEAYLGIEQARLGDRLQVRIDVPEELESIEIPPLSLQVLVENAVKHGVAPSEHGGTVEIRASRKGDTLELEVHDPGTGISNHQGTGTALETLRQRLAKPEDLSLKATSDGVRATLRWRIA
jgi:two-component sensor histidine kinase